MPKTENIIKKSTLNNVDTTSAKNVDTTSTTTQGAFLDHGTNTTQKKTSTPRKRPISRKRNQFGNMAMRYYPGRGYKTAIRLMRKEIVLTRGLLEALQAAGYQEHQRLLTPRQVMIIEKFLGEP